MAAAAINGAGRPLTSKSSSSDLQGASASLKVLSDSNVRDQRQMIGRDQREPRPRQLDADDVHPAGIVNVIEVEQREETGIGSPPFQVVAQVNALQPSAEQLRRRAAHPLVEVAKHNLRAPDMAVRDDVRQPLGLIAPLEDRGAKVDVVDVQRVAPDRDVRSLQTSLLAGLPRKIV